ncbi:MAG: hypothetical protein QXU32_04890 [Nitrososphaerales archaeon]
MDKLLAVIVGTFMSSLLAFPLQIVSAHNTPTQVVFPASDITGAPRVLQIEATPGFTHTGTEVRVYYDPQELLQIPTSCSPDLFGGHNLPGAPPGGRAWVLVGAGDYPGDIRGYTATGGPPNGKLRIPFGIGADITAKQTGADHPPGIHPILSPIHIDEINGATVAGSTPYHWDEVNSANAVIGHGTDDTLLTGTYSFISCGTEIRGTDTATGYIGTSEFFVESIPDRVGGEILSVDQAALIVSGVSIHAHWFLPLIVGVGMAAVTIMIVNRKPW